MNKLLAITALLIGACAVAEASEVHSEMTFYRSVTLAPWSPATTVRSISQAVGGAHANTSTWYYAIAATNTAGEATLSNVTNLTLTATNNLVLLTWSLVPGASGYRVFRGATGSTLTNMIGISGGTTNFIDYGTNTWSVATPTNTAAASVPVLLMPSTWTASNSNAVPPLWYIQQYLQVSNENDTIQSVLDRGSSATNGITLGGALIAASFSGDGSLMSAVNASRFGGFFPTNLPPSALMSNVFLSINRILNHGGTIVSNNLTVTGVVSAASFIGSGAGLTALPDPFLNRTNANIAVTNALGTNLIINSSFTTTNGWVTHFAAIDTNTGMAVFNPGASANIETATSIPLIPGKQYMIRWYQQSFQLSTRSIIFANLGNPQYTIPSSDYDGWVSATFLNTTTGSTLKVFGTAIAPGGGYFNLLDIEVLEITNGTLAVASSINVGGASTFGSTLRADAAIDGSNSGSVLNRGANDLLYGRFYTNAPASNTASGAIGDRRFYRAAGTNWFSWFHPDAAGIGTGGWPRVEGSMAY